MLVRGCKVLAVRGEAYTNVPPVTVVRKRGQITDADIHARDYCVNMADVKRAVDSTIPHHKPIASFLPVDAALSAICKHLKAKMGEIAGNNNRREAEAICNE
jgi:hypothetical protein